MKKTLLVLLALLAVPALCWAGEEAAPTIMTNADAIKGVQTNLNYVWTLVCAALVFFMQAGFAC
ncbi:MAG: ammonium transporter, partial [Desulfocapsaceae bacterium]|nr:ammonium transporter [Desulfocapsaceae bacterium]